jgi:hypothetical protein
VYETYYEIKKKVEKERRRFYLGDSFFQSSALLFSPRIGSLSFSLSNKNKKNIKYE